MVEQSECFQYTVQLLYGDSHLVVGHMQSFQCIVHSLFGKSHCFNSSAFDRTQRMIGQLKRLQYIFFRLFSDYSPFSALNLSYRSIAPSRTWAPFPQSSGLEYSAGLSVREARSQLLALISYQEVTNSKF